MTKKYNKQKIKNSHKKIMYGKVNIPYMTVVSFNQRANAKSRRFVAPSIHSSFYQVDHRSDKRLGCQKIENNHV